MFDDFDRVLELQHVGGVRFVRALMVSGKGALRVVKRQIDVLLAFELVSDASDDLDEVQAVACFVCLLESVVGFYLGLHSFRALALYHRVQCTPVCLVELQLLYVNIYFLLPYTNEGF